MVRKIKVMKNLSSKIIETNATTFGDLFPILKSNNIIDSDLSSDIALSNYRFSVPNSDYVSLNFTIESEQTKLPEDDFVMFINIKKVPSGLDLEEKFNQIQEEFDDIKSDLDYIKDLIINFLDNIEAVKEDEKDENYSTYPEKSEEDLKLERLYKGLNN